VEWCRTVARTHRGSAHLFWKLLVVWMPCVAVVRPWTVITSRPSCMRCVVLLLRLLRLLRLLLLLLPVVVRVGGVVQRSPESA
jgi:hypothetical protein